MVSLGRKISTAAIASVATLGLLVIASAPAASGRAAEARPFLAHTTRQVDAVERPRQLASWQRGARRFGTADGVPEVRKIEHAVSGEGVAATLAAAWHARGITGKGVKIAVIDGGFRGLAQLQAAGELPANVVTSDFCRGRFATATAHGTAVAEIVHEMAPDAQLYLLCIDTGVDLAAAVRFAKANGVHIVNHSMGWAGPWRGDGSSPIGRIVADARAAGILWVNSAGNEAETHWSGSYNPSAGLHAWDAGSDLGNTFLWPDGTEICGFLRWDEWPAGISDFDLGLFLADTGEYVDSSDEEQGSGEPPFEAVCAYQDSGRDVVAFWAVRGWSVTTSPPLDFVSWSPPLEHRNAAGSIGEPATSSAALAVGALCWQTRELEPFSSQGPTIDGRIKPDLVGHDSVSGSTYGPFEGCPSGFAGTSASSPEVAGAAALVEQAYPAFGPQQLQDYLLRNAADVGTPGVDNATGAGELRLPPPPDVSAPRARALTTRGRLGKTVRLLSTVGDDSGEVRVVVHVKRNGRVVATLQRDFIAAGGSTRIGIAWRAPKGPGPYRHCVRASDRTGNTSPLSCAQLVLR
jgi:subtilisin family serine protease